MTQTYQKVLTKRPEIEPIGDLNPRYFEEGISLKEAKEKVHACVGSKFDLFSAF